MFQPIITVKHGKWTPQEDFELKKAVETLPRGESNKISFTKVCRTLSSARTPKQAQERWENHLRPGLKSGEWSDEETSYLLELISLYGYDWSLFAKKIRNRGFHGIKVKGRSLLKETLTRRKATDPPRCPAKFRKEWSDEEIERLVQVHLRYKKINPDLQYSYNKIGPELLYFRPAAHADRKLIKNCKCDSCLKRLKEIMSINDSFKNAWSMKAAKLLKQKYKSERDEYDDLPSYVGQSSYQDSTSSRSCDDKISIILSTSTSTSCGNSEYTASTLSKRKRKNPESKLNMRLLDFLGSNHECQSMQSSNKRGSEYSELKNFLKQLYQLVHIIPAEEFISTFEKYMTQNQLLQLLSTTRLYANFSMVNPSLNYLLSLKVNPEYVDPRYNLDFLFPQECDFFPPSFDRPIGRILFENTTCMGVDGDSAAKNDMGSVVGRHWFDMMASPLNAFFLFGNLYPRLMETGEVWTRQTIVNGKGEKQIYLAHIQVDRKDPKICLFRMQNVSDMFPHILNLPPEY